MEPRVRARTPAELFPRPEDERQILRHKAYTLATSTVEEAALEMDLLDYDFHLFIEEGTNQDSVIYRAGPTGYRLAQVNPVPERRLVKFEQPVTISPSRPRGSPSSRPASAWACSGCRSCFSSMPSRTAAACCITAATGTTV